MRGVLLAAMCVAALFIMTNPPPAEAGDCRGGGAQFGRFDDFDRDIDHRSSRGVRFQREFIVDEFTRRNGDRIGITNRGNRVFLGNEFRRGRASISLRF
jgi:hypothetical protein